jgi:ketosteroid isomerase-like protein
MSQQNVDLVRSSCEAWLRGDSDAFESMDPEVEWDTTHFEGWMEKAVYRGRDEVRRFLAEEWLASWDGYEAGIDDLLDAGDRVLVLWWQRMVGREGGVPVALDSAQVWSIRDGRIMRIDNYTDRSEAFEAAGLPG